MEEKQTILCTLSNILNTNYNYTENNFNLTITNIQPNAQSMQHEHWLDLYFFRVPNRHNLPKTVAFFYTFKIAY